MFHCLWWPYYHELESFQKLNRGLSVGLIFTIATELLQILEVACGKVLIRYCI